MLGRLICGDDCLVQIFYSGKPTDKFRYQIQSSNIEEGILWGNKCAKLFKVTPKQFQKPTGEYCSNFIIKSEYVRNLIKKGFLTLPKLKTSKNTGLALIKCIPIYRILKFNKDKLSEFLAGLFDSDGTIRPSKGEIRIALDSQMLNRKVPLVFKEIKMFIELDKAKLVPKINRVVVATPNCNNKRAKYIFNEIKRNFPSIPLSMIISKGRKGTTVTLNLSTCARWNRLAKNREPLRFWRDFVIPKLIRTDKRKKFEKFFEIRNKFL